ncbi:copper resistance protein CopC [Streptomyces sp. SID8375]|uniref:copper resistance CopC/CopD family protein n=1 Tax=unclassified Streptomyces TaxID=2593676 RepID=UPI00036C5BA2|nr:MULTISPECIES: copper resistance protein CopC [unclassified Streptomyces]MYX09215.1 copper resistance protein CopC [Streptomyces sp. SID8375]
MLFAIHCPPVRKPTRRQRVPEGSRSGRTGRRRAAALLLGVLLVLAGPATVAQAHASLVTTTPGASARLSTVPRQVGATFSEPVEAGLGSMKVYGPDGSRVDAGTSTHGASDREIVAGVRNVSAHGTYTVAWRVVSADSHPIQGAFTFSVGTPTRASAPIASDAGSPVVSALHASARLAAYCGFALMIGGAVFCLVCWPSGYVLPRRARRLTAAGGGVLLVATLGQLLLQGPYGAGLGPSSAFDPAVLAATVDTRIGTALIFRALLLIATAHLLLCLPWEGSTQRPRPWRAVPPLGLIAVTLAATWAASGHMAVGAQIPVAVPVDVVHLVAMAVWAGGLTALLTLMIRRRGTQRSGTVDDSTAVVDAARRFSRLALGCVVTLAVTGAYQSWRQTGLSFDGLTATPYGRLLLAKTGGVVLMVGLGGAARRRLHRAHTEPGVPVLRRLRNAIVAECVLVAAVLVITTTLVGTRPANDALALPMNAELRYDTGTDRGTAQVVIDPPRVGPTVIHLYVLDGNGMQRAVDAVEVRLTLPSRDIGPLPVRLSPAGPGHYVSAGTVLPMAGDWRLSVSLRTSDVESAEVSHTVEVR